MAEVNIKALAASIAKANGHPDSESYAGIVVSHYQESEDAKSIPIPSQDAQQPVKEATK